MTTNGDDRREFAAMVRGDSYRRYVLAQLLTMRKRLLLMANEVDSIRQALFDHAIDPDRALGDLAQLGSLWFLQPTPLAPFDAADDTDTEKQNGF